MASVFLSYAREDARIAGAVAELLERSGHEVWWDRHIRGGSQFAGAIEQALKSADVIVVIWSKASVESAWVRDEASEGRDTNRLVPVAIGGCRAPIGFRQFQTVDLPGWSGKRKPKQFSKLLEAVDEIAPEAGRQRDKQSDAPPAPQRSRYLIPAVAAALALLLLAVGGWFYLDRSAAAAATPTVAVLPFTDLSPQRDKEYLAEGIAEAILTSLGREGGINVVGRTSSWQFKDRSADLRTIRSSLGVTHVLEGSARTSGDQLRMSVRLLDAASGKQVWAEEYDRRLSNVFAVQDQIGRAVAARLTGSLATKRQRPAAASTDVDVYGLYLAGRAKMRERNLPALKEALALARQAVAKDPNYAPGHALMADLTWLLAGRNYGSFDDDEAKAAAIAHARKAMALAPNSSEGYAAYGNIIRPDDPPEAARMLERAIQLDPSRGELHLWLGMTYGHLHRNSEALQQFRRAVEIDPLFYVAVARLAFTLDASGRQGEALQVAEGYRRRGGNRALALSITGSIVDEGQGDISQAVKLNLEARRLDPSLTRPNEALTDAYFDVGLSKQAQHFARDKAPAIRLFFGGQLDQLGALARGDAAGVWANLDGAMTTVRGLSLVRDWPAVVLMYDRRRKDWNCGLTEAQATLDFAVALRAEGRNSEAAEQLKCVSQIVQAQAQGPVRMQDLPLWSVAADSAQILALTGNGEGALREMKRAVDLGYRTPHGWGLKYFPALDPVQSSPLYRELDSRLNAYMARERAEVLREGLA